VGPGRGTYGPRRAGEHGPTGENEAGLRPTPGPNAAFENERRIPALFGSPPTAPVPRLGSTTDGVRTTVCVALAPGFPAGIEPPRTHARPMKEH
jgi:hypothetical protein